MQIQIDSYIFDIEIKRYSAGTVGSYSSKASDPDEYYGIEQDVEFEINYVEDVFDDGSSLLYTEHVNPKHYLNICAYYSEALEEKVLEKISLEFD